MTSSIDLGPNKRPPNTGSTSTAPAPAPADAALPTSEPPPWTRPYGNLSGTVGVEGGAAYVQVGGVRLELFVGPTPAPHALAGARRAAVAAFQRHHGQEVVVRGRQVGGALTHATVITRSTTTDWPALDAAAQAQFRAVVAAIKAHRDALFAKYPELVELRPGYRFKDAWITSAPCVVAVVRRKLAKPTGGEIQKDPLLLAAGVEVDVTSEPPDRARRRAGKATGPSPHRSDLALPAWDAVDDVAQEVGGEGEEARELYVAPEGVPLDEVVGPMTITCHVSPDAGWPTLRGFLAGVQRDLTVGMYDFTAPHILKSVRTAMRDATGTLRLVLDPKVALPKEDDTESNKADDLSEVEVRDSLRAALGDRFQTVWAAVTSKDKVSGGIFATSYHLKVAVADSRAVWLSSGNWQSSNQPDVDPQGADADRLELLRSHNREWHVVVEGRKLARLFERYLKWDYDQAAPLQVEVPEAAEDAPDLFVPEAALERGGEGKRFFPPLTKRFTRDAPLRVQPLLTPDNYRDHVLPLVLGARERLYFQNQYITLGKPATRADLREKQELFMELVHALRDKANDPAMDVKIILRGGFGDREMLEALVADGFPQGKIKIQQNCHTKGIIVDGEVVLVGSHNWSSSGTVDNRDASVILHDAELARYYEEIFLHDWEHLARHKVVSEEPFDEAYGMPQVAEPGAPTPRGHVRVRWDALDDDG